MKIILSENDLLVVQTLQGPIHISTRKDNTVVVLDGRPEAYKDENRNQCAVLGPAGWVLKK